MKRMLTFAVVLLCLVLVAVMTLALPLTSYAGSTDRPMLTITGFGNQVDDAGDEVLTVEAVTDDGEAVKLVGDKPALWVTGADYQSASIIQVRDPNLVKEYYTMEDLIMDRVEYTVAVGGETENYVCTLKQDARFYYEMEDGMVRIVFDKEQFIPESEMEDDT